ncbi:hypothetical protein BDZ91DRAFT_801044 [Kalaharituber pfeilii]|nr:hypothetical protein BDZ91DRAFT_801044 [Kalaharituber pfeilii]
MSAQEGSSTLSLTWSDLSPAPQELVREYTPQHLWPKSLSTPSVYGDDDDDDDLGSTHSSIVLSHTDPTNVSKHAKGKQRQSHLSKMSRITTSAKKGVHNTRSRVSTSSTHELVLLRPQRGGRSLLNNSSGTQLTQ